jgi:hypothetical protein
VQEKEKIMTKEEKENRYWMEGEERRCRMCFEEKKTIEHMCNGCSEMKEGEGKKRGKYSVFRRKGDRIDERDMEEEGKNREGDGWGIGIKKTHLSFVKNGPIKK